MFRKMPGFTLTTEYLSDAIVWKCIARCRDLFTTCLPLVYLPVIVLTGCLQVLIDLFVYMTGAYLLAPHLS